MLPVCKHLTFYNTTVVCVGEWKTLFFNGKANGFGGPKGEVKRKVNDLFNLICDMMDSQASFNLKSKSTVTHHILTQNPTLHTRPAVPHSWVTNLAVFPRGTAYLRSGWIQCVSAQLFTRSRRVTDTLAALGVCGHV